MSFQKVLTLAIQRFDRTDALHTGDVKITDVMVMHVPPPVGVDGLLKGVFDAAEMPLAHYAFLKDQGDSFTAIPVFPDRLFIQQYIYTRPETGIRSPAQLRGRRVLLPMYYMTASFWHRAMLHDEYGISASEIEWHTTSPERDSRMRMPEGIKIVLSPGPHFGTEKLLDGTVDCLMTEGTPTLKEGLSQKIVRVHSAAAALQRDFYRRTGFHLIVHVIVLRNEAVAERPTLPQELCEAFDGAKSLAYKRLYNERMTSLPLMRSYLDETIELFGDDPWAYGLERNSDELNRFLTYAHNDALIRRKLSAEELFDNSAKNYFFKARLP